MKNLYNYKNLDLRSATVYDVAELFPGLAPIYVSTDEKITKEQQRILSLICYAETHEIQDLYNQLNQLFKNELQSID